MKRALIIVFALALCLGLTGCGGLIDKYNPKLSEIRSNVLVSPEDSPYKITAISGRREDPFMIDGISGKKQDFTVITLKPESDGPIIDYKYRISLNDTEYEGVMIKHPFDITYSADIPVKTDQVSLKLFITVNNNESEVDLKTIRQHDFISPEKALEIAEKKLKKSIKQFKSQGADYEVYLRLINNPISEAGGYYWYAAFVGSNDQTYAVLIDPVSTEIVAIRE